VNLVINGRQSVLVHTGEEIIDLLRQGQGVLNILPLSGVKLEVDAAIVQFPSERDRPAQSAMADRSLPEAFAR
jgi:hypothetical protein